MLSLRHLHSKQLTALLLIVVMSLVHVTKALHTHASVISSHTNGHKQTYTQAHTHCSICEFHLAKDTPFTGDILIQITPAFFSPVYSRILTAINPDPLFVIDSRGPPSFKA
jgi:hypothetical protein